MESVELPADAVEVGRIVDAWGIKGWFKVQPHSADPQALFSSKRWFLVWPSSRGLRPARPADPPRVALLRIREAREHGMAVVASAQDLAGREAAEALKGAAVFIPRSSFPSTGSDEFYWIDLLGLQVVNREGVVLGEVVDLLPTGPQTVLVVRPAHAIDDRKDGTRQREHLIPFVSAYVDAVDHPGRVIRVDWQDDYLD